MGEGHGSGEALGSAAARNPPAYGRRNAGTVHRGTGEALLGRVKANREGVGAGHSTAGGRGTTEPTRGKARQPDDAEKGTPFGACPSDQSTRAKSDRAPIEALP